MARPKNQAPRRQNLIAVTSHLLVERGAAGTRLTDIAEAAGVTPAAVSYYYPNLVDLFADTYQTATEQYVTKRRELVEAVEGAAAQLVEFLRLGVPEAGTSSRAATVLLIELAALESREERIAQFGAEFRRHQLDLLEGVLTHGIENGEFTLGHPVPECALLLLGIEDGFATSVVAGWMSAEESLRLTLLLAGQLTGADFAAPAVVR